MIKFNSKPFRDRFERAVMRGIIRGAEGIRNEAVSLILNTTKSGRVYRRRGTEHQASAPGEPPASDTGTLVNSIETSYDFKALSGSVVVRAAHGPPLEFGTRKMAARPFMRPALANKGGDAETFIKEELRKEFGI